MFDNISKFLIEQYSPDFASWLVGEPIALTELSPSQLSLEPIRADALILLQAADVVLHCEFQTAPDSTMPFRMADYALRVFRRFPQKRLVQAVIYLCPTDSELVQQTTFTANRLHHEFEVVRLWEQPTEIQTLNSTSVAERTYARICDLSGITGRSPAGSSAGIASGTPRRSPAGRTIRRSSIACPPIANSKIGRDSDCHKISNRNAVESFNWRILEKHC